MAIVEFVEFPLDTSIVAPVIYKEWTRVGVAHWEYVDQPHRVTPHGVRIGREVSRELAQLLYQYTQFIYRPGQYCRADVLVTPDSLQLLEVNMAFIDGWGTSLNLARAAGFQVTPPTFPRCFVQAEEQYLPELELLLRELGGNHRVCKDPDCDGPTCYYGWPDPRVEDKRWLVRFRGHWGSDLVQIPRFYTQETGVDWEDIPDDVYIKFIDKRSPESVAARFSVKRGKPTGKAPSLRRAYREGRLIAQERVDGLGMGGLPGGAAIGPDSDANPSMQLVVMAADLNYLTGYVQYAHSSVITDDSVHGPLQFDW